MSFKNFIIFLVSNLSDEPWIICSGVFGNQAKRVESTINNYDFANNLLSIISESKPAIEKKTNTKIKDLKDFYKLYKDGIISKEEYEKEKAKIISGEKKSVTNSTNKVVMEPKTHSEMPTDFSNAMKNIMIQKYNEKYNTNFQSFEEMQKDLINRKAN